MCPGADGLQCCRHRSTLSTVTVDAERHGALQLESPDSEEQQCHAPQSHASTPVTLHVHMYDLDTANLS